MGLQSLHQVIESHFPGASLSVDLLKIASTIAKPYQGRPALSLVVDGECCLDRLYGGYVSDWTCGGQWNRMFQFLTSLVQTLHLHNIHIAVFFNGALEPSRMQEWVRNQLVARSNIYQVLRHLNTKGTPPPKVWWVPPSGLRTCLRLALRHLKVVVLCSVDDHHQEVISFCRDNNFHGLLAEEAEYAIFGPPRYFSSKQLKLTYKGSLETKEFIMDEVAKGLNLNPNRFPILAALLGNFLLTDADLREFHKRTCENYDEPLNQPEGVLRAVASFVRELPSVDNLDSVAQLVFPAAGDSRQARFKQAVQYNLNGTKEFYGKYKHATLLRQHSYGHQRGKPGAAGQSQNEHGHQLASESTQNGHENLKSFTSPHTPVSVPADQASEEHGLTNGGSCLQPASSSSSSSGATSPIRETAPVVESDDRQQQKSVLPPVSPEVLRTAYERHRRGLMSPSIYQLLTQGEICLPVVLEDQCHREVPNIQLFYRPVRQMVYAILFNLHHHTFLAEKRREQQKNSADTSTSQGSYTAANATSSSTTVPEIKIREWVWTATNPYRHPELVPALPVGWPVPTVHRLWFGTSLDDKKRRLRAFLSCLDADTSLMLNADYVPQHLLVLACVLRYIMAASQGSVLHKHELDAFIVQAFAIETTNPNYLQDLQLTKVSARGVQLATLFMEGVEVALLVNDACGSPVPWPVCCPWLFFDGKLFHTKLTRTATVRDLHELCEHRVDLIMKVEKLRKAILEGLVLHPFPRPPPLHEPRFVRDFMPVPPAMPLPAASKRGTPGVRRETVSHGAQLEVGGVVVGSWGANYGTARGRGCAPVISGPAFVGRGRSGMPASVQPAAAGGSSQTKRVTFSTRGGRVARGKRGGSVAQASTRKSASNKVEKLQDSGESKDPRGTVKLLTHSEEEHVEREQQLNEDREN